MLLDWTPLNDELKRNITGFRAPAPVEAISVHQMSSRWEVPNQCPRFAAVRDRSALTYDFLAVYPNPFQTERRNIDTTRARRQIRYAALLAAADGLRVEQDDIRLRARDETTSIRDAIGIGETACHHLHALL